MSRVCAAWLSWFRRSIPLPAGSGLALTNSAEASLERLQAISKKRVATTPLSAMSACLTRVSTVAELKLSAFRKVWSGVFMLAFAALMTCPLTVAPRALSSTRLTQTSPMRRGPKCLSRDLSVCFAPSLSISVSVVMFVKCGSGFSIVGNRRMSVGRTTDCGDLQSGAKRYFDCRFYKFCHELILLMISVVPPRFPYRFE